MAPTTVRRTRAKNLTGQRFGLLTAIEPTARRYHSNIVWRCSCDCGGTAFVGSNTLLTGNTQSCGCRSGHPTHGAARGDRHTPEYSAWASMRQRCLNPRHSRYATWGGRGITVCERWASFEAFYADMGPKLIGTTLDRIDNSKGYAPDNCRWATPKQQSANTRISILVTINGETDCVSGWCRRLNIPKDRVHSRINRGMSPIDALTLPLMTSGRKRHAVTPSG